MAAQHPVPPAQGDGANVARQLSGSQRHGGILPKHAQGRRPLQGVAGGLGEGRRGQPHVRGEGLHHPVNARVLAGLGGVRRVGQLRLLFYPPSGPCVEPLQSLYKTAKSSPTRTTFVTFSCTRSCAAIICWVDSRNAAGPVKSPSGITN